MKTTVIHHSADYDGIFCREIAKKFLPDAELIGWDFADAPLGATRLTTGEQIYILDLPVDKVFAIAPTLELTKNVVWIDHHKSSIESHPVGIPGYRIDGVAACRLAWQWFTHDIANNVMSDPAYLPTKQDFIDRKVDEPLAVRLAGEYDIWDKRDPAAEVFQFGLRSRKLTDADWEMLLGKHNLLVDSLLSQGTLLQEYQQSNDKGIMHRSFLLDFAKLKFLALNTARCNSLTFASKDIPETGHDALMGFYWNGKLWTVSMYHAKHNMGIDLSQIAVERGGGGHKGACGFTCQAFPF